MATRTPAAPPPSAAATHSGRLRDHQRRPFIFIQSSHTLHPPHTHTHTRYLDSSPLSPRPRSFTSLYFHLQKKPERLMSQDDSRREANSFCCTPDTAAGKRKDGRDGASEKEDSRDHLPASSCRPDALLWRGSFAFQCFCFHFSFFHPPQSHTHTQGTASPLVSGLACPSLPCPLYLGRPPLVHGPAGLPLSPPERTEGGTAEEAAASCRLGSPPRRRRGWCGGGGAHASQSPRLARRGQGRRGLDLPNQEAGALPRVPRRRTGCSPGPLLLPGRPGIPGHPTSSE